MIDLTADPDEPKALASERIAEACRELRRLHLLTGYFDERGYWFPSLPAAEHPCLPRGEA